MTNKLTEFARDMRKNPTVPEGRLWKWFKKKKFKVRRQHTIDLGTHKYIADFYIPQTRLIIEIDGSIHNLKEQKEYDITRDEILKQSGYTVMRLTNEEVEKDIKDVLLKIEKIILVSS